MVTALSAWEVAVPAGEGGWIITDGVTKVVVGGASSTVMTTPRAFPFRFIISKVAPIALLASVTPRDL